MHRPNIEMCVVLVLHLGYVAHYNLCRVHEALRITPAMALGVTDHVWTIGELVEAALGQEPDAPAPLVPSPAPDRPPLSAKQAGRPALRVVRGGLS
jgi:hypothetical protein